MAIWRSEQISFIDYTFSVDNYILSFYHQSLSEKLNKLGKLNNAWINDCTFFQLIDKWEYIIDILHVH